MLRRWFIVVLVAIGAVAAYAQTREKPASAAPGTYRVTPWPPQDAGGTAYGEEVQDFLNKMAADGWRFHGDLSGQFGKMLVFERSTGR
jgi:hypothetical protein